MDCLGWAVDRAAIAPARLALAFLTRVQWAPPSGVASLRPDIASSMNDQKVGFHPIRSRPIPA